MLPQNLINRTRFSLPLQSSVNFLASCADLSRPVPALQIQCVLLPQKAELPFDQEIAIDDLDLHPTPIWDRRIQIDRATQSQQHVPLSFEKISISKFGSERLHLLLLKIKPAVLNKRSQAADDVYEHKTNVLAPLDLQSF
ncbi:hypothetical protein OUZ56_010682 [Daphnia magna]|uniref:Uncharacterized protein n=1 Tax=Daphnia magna TaxID=35525 RepID=A0ABR0AJ91_9CRUS|nr:hypothetical protein OUZ56_010682 [Daphnia magna]